MAIEDAIVLARCLIGAETSREAFERFHQNRRRRTSQTVAMSRLWGRAGLWKHPALVAVRDGAFRYAPSSVLQGVAASQYCYGPGVPVERDR